ncbi:MAG: hypothetical protein IPG55_00665 [Saprospiraceae bacterium]|nr:hypothetical protein [Candidatus Defluviibacterium haderslevense]MBK7243793.1 hypothetical protein [Candidatus Defluviibacterium haderslevense]
MKNIYLFLIIFCCTINYSCKKCELIEQTITNPDVPCEGTFYINRAEPGVDLFFFFNEFTKPISNPLQYANGPGPNPVPTLTSNIISNFSAYDKINNQYIYEYIYDLATTPKIRFHHHNITTFTSTFSSPMSSFYSPVFHGGRLFAIQVDPGTSSVQYKILEINPLNGQELNTLDIKNIVVNSPLVGKYMSSISDGGNNIYFLSGTNLIEVKVSSGNSQHFDIDPSFSPTNNYLGYFGLEFKKDEGILIAMKRNLDLNAIPVTALVSINHGSTSVIKEILNITSQFPSTPDKTINTDNYSTTFDQCDNTYYITERENSTSTNLISIYLNRNTLKSQNLDFYWYGIEYMAKK